ncbi:MAG: heavy metal-associated domain-containing protein [Actinomycetota bacterium]
MSNQIFPVTGLTCGHCVGAVTTEVSAVPGVTDVKIDLVVGGTSAVSVTADKAISDAEVSAALEEAGDGDYVLAPN